MFDFSIPSDTQLLVDTVRRFVTQEVQPLENETEALGHVPPEALKRVRGKAQELACSR